MREDEDLVKITVRVYSSDITWLRQYFPTMGHNVVVRRIIRRFRLQTEKKLSKTTKEDGDDNGEINGGSLAQGDRDDSSIGE